MSVHLWVRSRQKIFWGCCDCFSGVSVWCCVCVWQKKKQAEVLGKKKTKAIVTFFLPAPCITQAREHLITLIFKSASSWCRLQSWSSWRRHWCSRRRHWCSSRRHWCSRRHWGSSHCSAARTFIIQVTTAVVFNKGIEDGLIEKIIAIVFVCCWKKSCELSRNKK